MYVSQHAKPTVVLLAHAESCVVLALKGQAAQQVD